MLPPGSGGDAADGEGAVPTTYELHFQEWFTGEPVEIVVNGAVVARLEARTRAQISVAHVEKLVLSPGDEVTIRVADRPPKRVPLDPGKPYILVNLLEGELSVEATQASPGYL
jgi:hypothetical protein